MNALLEKCPVCTSPLEVVRLRCTTCGTAIEGSFSPSNNPFAKLTPEQVQFVLTFVRCEGRLNRMEEQVNASYPTIRNRLLEIIRALGYEPGGEDVATRLNSVDRLRILDDLQSGVIDADQARRMLQGQEI